MDIIELSPVIRGILAFATVVIGVIIYAVLPKREKIDEVEYIPPTPPLPEPPKPPVVPPTPVEPPVPPKPAGINYGKWPDLVKALIQAESQGLDTAIGDKNLVNKAYGPLQIRKPYVDDVNRVYGGNLKAQDMLGKRQLSIDTFYRYMGIYATKKQLGTDPTYEIIARIHNGGPKGHKNPVTAGYWKKVQRYL